MKVASKLDLLFEKWLRDREKKEIVWITKDKTVMPIRDMSDKHLENTIKMLQEEEDKFNKFIEALGSIGGLDI